MLDFLYWTISEVGTDNWAQVITPKTLNQSSKILGLNFNWRPGFRIGTNYLSENHQWDSNLYYTWYQTQALQSERTTTAEIHSPFSGNFYAQNTLGNGVSGPYYLQGAINWGFLYNNIDWEVGRLFDLTNYKLRPFLGIKTAFINQKISTSWGLPFDNSTKQAINTFSLATENIINNFWGIGPSFGLNNQWKLYHFDKHHFNLFGDFAGAFLWGGWSISDIYKNNTPVSITTMNNIRSSGLLMSSGLVGINWQLNSKNYDLIFKFAYEAQMWMNQLKFYSFEGGRLNNTLYIQGGVLNACIHF